LLVFRLLLHIKGLAAAAARVRVIRGRDKQMCRAAVAVAVDAAVLAVRRLREMREMLVLQLLMLANL